MMMMDASFLALFAGNEKMCLLMTDISPLYIVQVYITGAYHGDILLPDFRLPRHYQ